MSLEQKLKKISLMEREISELKTKLGGQDPDHIIKRHISLLHRYNELKDSVTLMTKKLASLEHTTVDSVYHSLGYDAEEIGKW